MPNDAQHHVTTRELYRSPAPDLRMGDVVQLDTEHQGALSEAEQAEWAARRIAATTGELTAKAVRAARATPPPAARPPDVATVRQELHDAIRQYADAEAAATLADDAYVRAQNLVAAADGRLADFAGLREKIRQARADAIRRGDGNAPLPTDLARMQTEAGAAADRDSELREAMGQLAAEAAEAKAALAQADQKRAACAGRVVLAGLDGLADALAVLDAKAAALREALYSAAACYLICPGASPPVIALSVRARDVLLREPVQLAVDHEFNHALQAWHVRLQNDSEATLGGMCDAVGADAA